MHDRKEQKKRDIPEFKEMRLTIAKWRAAQHHFETLKKLSQLEAGYPDIVGKSKTCQSTKRFSMSIFQHGFDIRRSAIIALGLVILSLLISVTFSGAYNSENGNPLESMALAGKLLKTTIVPDYYPYTFVNDQGMPDGFSVDIAKAVVQVMDMKLEIRVDTWEHAEEALENGTIDFLPMMASSPLRRQSFDFSVPHTIAYDAVFVRRGTQRISSLNDLAGKTIIVMNKDAAHDFILTTSISDTIKLILVDSLPDGLRLLASGKGDAAIMPKLVGLLLVKKLNITNIEESTVTIESYNRPFSFAVKKGNAALLESLSQGLSIVDANGQYRSIYDKWFGVLAPRGMPWKSVLKYITGIVAVSALVGMVLFIWSLSLRKMVKQRTVTLESEIAVRNKTEAALGESEERFRLAMEAANDGVWDWDLKTDNVFRSPGFFSMLGYNPEDFPGRVGDWHHLVHPDDLQTVQQELGECLAGEREANEAEFRVRTKSGDTVWILSRGKVVVRDENGKPVRMVGTHTDITERKKAEEQIEKQASLMESLLEAMPAPVFYKDTDHVYLGCNDAFVEFIGLPKENIVGKSVFAVAPRELAEIYKNHDEALFQNPGSQVYESSVKAINGSMRNVMVHKATFTGGSGEVAGLIGVILDITDRKRAEEALIESEARVRMKLDSIISPEGDIGTLELADVIDTREIQMLMEDFYDLTNIGVAILDLKGKVLVATGWQEICTKFHRVHPETRRNCIASDTQISSGIEKGTFKLYCCMNNMWDIATPIMVGEQHLGNLFLGQFLFEDDSPDYDVFRSQAQKYGFDEQQYLAALERVPRWSRETVDRVMRFYTKLTRILSTSSYRNINLARSLAERERLVVSLQESEEKYRHLFENAPVGIMSVDTEGRILEVNQPLLKVLGSPSTEATKAINIFELPQLVESGISDALRSCIATGDRVLKEVPYVSKWGKRLHLRVVLTSVADEERNILGCQATVEDITQQREMEDQLRQVQKMEAVGTLAGGIAHDFNNLLHIISGHAELLEIELAERDMRFGEMDAIRRAAHRGADLVKQILTFSRKVDTKFESINLNEDIHNTERLLYRTIPKMIEIDLRLEEGLRLIRADSTQVEQMLINLAVNAKDAMPDGGKLTIETQNVLFDEDYCKSHAELAPGRSVLLRVSDTGHGMEEDVLQHIFEPFYTTKGLADGTGLGLATVFGIVKMHGGHITCESEVGKGTIFSIWFPAAEAVERDVEREQEAPAVAGGTETILVVDDEDLIRDLAKRILEKSGYSVLTAGSGKEGIDIYAEHKSDISLVILDLIMPEMGGKQCLEALLKINPQVKALIASGFAVKGDTRAFLDSEAKGMVPKPFSMRDLLRSVRHVLDGM